MPFYVDGHQHSHVFPGMCYVYIFVCVYFIEEHLTSVVREAFAHTLTQHHIRETRLPFEGIF